MKEPRQNQTARDAGGESGAWVGHIGRDVTDAVLTRERGDRHVSSVCRAGNLIEALRQVS